ncbi:potassium:proton antiporter [Aureococcus anophagefferens]|nr:potassium:proton antiporter [Aureococcus anophagefferens]
MFPWAEGRRLEQDDGEHEFHALNTLLLVVVLGLCILSAYLIKKYRFYFMPESSAALCVGLVVGGIARLITHSDEELNFLSFQPELFFFMLLPPIIFEAGYTLRRKNFFRNLGTITAYAVFGTVVSTFVVGYLTFACGKAGIIDIDGTNPMEALLFGGALISAVDPVATLSIMGSPELNCDPLLYSLVFGESVLNDAVAIVLFRTFYNYYEEGEELDQSKIPVALVEFLGVSLGSVFIGVITGLICSYIFRHTRIRDYPKYEISLLFLFAYGAYALAESIELSGIMALFFCGIVLAHYNSYNLSKTSQVTAEEIFSALSTVAESFVFMYMGMGFFTGRFKSWDGTFIFLAILFCSFARACNVFPLSFLSNATRSVKIPLRMQLVIWFAGLRGAIAFALSQNMPGPPQGRGRRRRGPGPGGLGIHGAWREIDNRYFKPMFGGQMPGSADDGEDAPEGIKRHPPKRLPPRRPPVQPEPAGAAPRIAAL